MKIDYTEEYCYNEPGKKLLIFLSRQDVENLLGFLKNPSQKEYLLSENAVVSGIDTAVINKSTNAAGVYHSNGVLRLELSEMAARALEGVSVPFLTTSIGAFNYYDIDKYYNAKEEFCCIFILK